MRARNTLGLLTEPHVTPKPLNIVPVPTDVIQDLVIDRWP